MLLRIEHLPVKVYDSKIQQLCLRHGPPALAATVVVVVVVVIIESWTSNNNLIVLCADRRAILQWATR